MNITRVSLAELCDGIFDCPHSTPVWTDSGYVVLRSFNIKNGRLDLTKPSYTDKDNYIDRIRRAKPEPFDIVITREAPMGEVAMIPDGLTCCLGQRMVLLKPNKEAVSPLFLLYALQGSEVQEQIRWSEGTGSTVSNLRIPDLAALSIPTPELTTQNAIGRLLGSLDDKIELNRRMNETLEAMARAIFRSWFVDFDPVRIKARGGDPVAELGLSPEIAALFPDCLQDSQLGEIPSGWRVGPPSDFCHVTLGGIWGNDNSSKPGDIEAIILRGVDLEDIRRHGYYPRAPRRWVPANSVNSRRPSEGQILIGGSGAGPCGRPLAWSDAYADTEGVPVVYSNFVKRFACQTNSQATYLDRVFWEMFNDGTMNYFIQGTSVPNLNDRSLLGYDILIPPETILEVFANLLKSLNGLKTTRESRLLAETRDYLLPLLLSGKIEVGEGGPP